MPLKVVHIGGETVRVLVPFFGEEREIRVTRHHLRSFLGSSGWLPSHPSAAWEAALLSAGYNNMLAEQAALIATLQADAGEMNSFAQAL